jgi:hypothetical protein
MDIITDLPKSFTTGEIDAEFMNVKLTRLWVSQ